MDTKKFKSVAVPVDVYEKLVEQLVAPLGLLLGEHRERLRRNRVLQAERYTSVRLDRIRGSSQSTES